LLQVYRLRLPCQVKLWFWW